MTDQLPAGKPAKAPRVHASNPCLTALHILIRAIREIGPYILALVIFAISIRSANLSTTAQRYADELMTLALVLIKGGNHLPPGPPPSGS